MNPTSFAEENLGGSRAGDATAQAEGWPQVLALLAGLGTGQRQRSRRGVESAEGAESAGGGEQGTGEPGSGGRG